MFDSLCGWLLSFGTEEPSHQLVGGPLCGVRIPFCDPLLIAGRYEITYEFSAGISGRLARIVYVVKPWGKPGRTMLVYDGEVW